MPVTKFSKREQKERADLDFIEADLLEGWEILPLGRIVKASTKRDNPAVDPNTPYIGLEHIERDTALILGKGTAVDVKSTKSVFREGDLLYGKLRPYLNKVWLAEFDGICSTDILVFPQSDAIDNRFLKYRLLARDFVNYANANSSGVNLPRVNLKAIERFEIPLPPLTEQRRIVARIEELFSHLDAGVAALRHAKAQLQRYRQSVLAAAVTGQLCGCENNKWRVVRLEDLVTIKSGNGFPKRFQGKTSGDYPFYKVGDISANWQEGRTSLISANNYLDEIEVRKIRGTLLPANTTVFAKIGAAVALNRRGLLTTSSLVDNNVMGLIPGNDIVPEYLFWFMCQVDLGAKTRGGAVPSLRKGDLEEIEINLPPLAEQHQIVAEVEARTTAIDHLEAELDHQITRSNRLRQSTLAAAFSGIL